ANVVGFKFIAALLDKTEAGEEETYHPHSRG
ncbi:unnamed protein product, partial [marine sediment metagenome]